MNTTIQRANLILDGTSYDDDGGFSCGNNFDGLAALIKWLIAHHGHGPGGGGPGPGDPGYNVADVTRQLSQVAAGLITFVGAHSVQDGALRTRVANEGLQRSVKALSGLQSQGAERN